MKRLTLEDIGKLAGVSRATVSRVVNNHPNISPEVRERVESVIRETGYEPNLAARSLASKRSNIIGLIIPSVLKTNFTDPYYSHLLRGISQACYELDYTIALYLFQNPEQEEKSLSKIVSSGMVDGVIITTDISHDMYAPLIKSKYTVPFIQLGSTMSRQEKTISYVDVDNIAGGYMATAHLVQQGRRRIAEITVATNTAGIDRHIGYQNALKERNLPIDPALTAYTEFGDIGGYQAMKTLLPQSPDGVFAQSDEMAIGAIKAIQEAGLRVPEDIAVVGFDDMPTAKDFDIPLTTIRQPIYKQGMLLIETLIDLIETSPEPARCIVLPVELIVRASSGAL